LRNSLKKIWNFLDSCSCPSTLDLLERFEELPERDLELLEKDLELGFLFPTFRFGTS
jgi:hypothetical protein